MKKNLFIVGLFIAAAFTLTSSVEASSSQFTVEIYLTSEGENVNTVGGVFNYPKSWTVKDIHLEGPDLLYWVEAPEVETFGALRFSAIFPGGVQNLGQTKDLRLYAVDFWGDKEELEQLSFSQTEFYLNHPTALSATETEFTYKVDNKSFFQKIQTQNLLTDLSYSFEIDPITHQDTLVIESYRGNLAAYDFFGKEGNLGSGQWLSVDGVQSLSSSKTTVMLNVRAPEGDEYDMVLRRSLTDRFILVFVFGGASLMFFYLFYLALNIFKLKPEDLTKK